MSWTESDTETADTSQLIEIAEEGWRLQVDTRQIAQFMFCKEPQELSYDEAETMLDIFADIGGGFSGEVGV